MNAVRMTLHECGGSQRFRMLTPGQYEVEYTDSTHLQPNDWVSLATLDVRSAAIPVQDETTEQFYTLTKRIGDLPGKPPAGTGKKPGGEKADPEADHRRRLRVIEDTLGLALGRVGLLAPDVSRELLDELVRLDRQDGVVIVPDTNTLHNGAVHWLLRVLRRPSVWLMPVVASMTTIQTRDATVKGLVNKERISNLGQALRSRGLVNGALGLLERNKGRCQVVEIDPSLLRYQKVASSTGADPDMSDVLEDRLIIEAIHGVLRSMRSRTARRVVTSDVNVARVLTAEGIETLFVPSIVLGDGPIDCLRFDALARGFMGAPLRATLWELAHAFGSVRLVRDGVELSKLECYWPGKTPAEWANEALLCYFSDHGSPTAAQPEAPASSVTDEPKPAQSPSPSAEDADVREVAVNDTASVDIETAERVSEPHVAAEIAPAARKRIVPITTSLPRASLPQMLRLLGVARRLQAGTVEQFVGEMRSDPISADKARRPLEILRRMGLIEQVENLYQVRADADVVDANLRSGDLDALSSIFQRFEPYRTFLAVLQSLKRIRRSDAGPLVQELIGPAGATESERLPRFHILLGQAWTDGNWIIDGSNRPTDRDATDIFEEAFRGTATVGIAKVQDLLLRYCELSSMSPWAAKQQIERFVAGRMLPAYNFQPAAGTKPLIRDEVLTGSLDRVELEPVIIDRLFLGERPVFTIEGPVR